MDALRAKIDECRRIVESAGSGGLLNARREKFLFFALSDMVRNAEHLLALYQYAFQSNVYIADGSELLLRKMIEQTMICCWIHQQDSDEPIDRYLKSSALAFETSWDQKSDDNDKDLPVDRLPKFARMAEKSIPGIYQAYKRLSYLQHADSHQFYTLIEHDHLISHKRSNRDIFTLRMADTLKVAPELLQHVMLYFAIEYRKNHPGMVEFLQSDQGSK